MAREFSDEELEALARGEAPAAAQPAPAGAAAVREFTDEELEELAASSGNASAASNPNTELSVSNMVGRQALGQGLALGFGDEIEAGARSIFSDKKYADIVKKIRGENKQFETANPLASLGMQVAGGAVTGLGPGAAIARGVANTGRVGRGLANMFTFNRANTVGGAALQGAKVGAAYGGVAGFGSGENDIVERGKSAVRGSVLGGAAGGVLAPAASTLGGGVARATRYINAKSRGADGQRELAMNRVAQQFNEDSIDPAALRSNIKPELARGQYADDTNDAIYDLWARGSTPSQIRDELNQRVARGELPQFRNGNYGESGVGRRVREIQNETMAVPRTLVDMAGDTAPGGGGARALEKEQETALVLGGRGASERTQELLERQVNMRDRMRGHIEQELDINNLDAAQRRAAQEDDLRQFAREEYNELRNNPVVLSGQNNGPGTVGEAISELRRDRFFADTERQMREFLSRRDPSAGDENLFSFDLVNEIQKALGKRARNHNADPVEADFYGRVRDEFLESMDKFFATPNASFRDVRARYRSAKEVIEAGELGSDVGRKRTIAARRKEQEASELTGVEREEYKLGVLDDYLSDIDSRQPHQNAAANMMNNNTRRRLEDVLGPDVAGRVMRKIEQENNASRRVGKIFGGSRTAPLQEQIKSFQNNAGAAADLATGNWLGFARKTADRVAELWREGDADAVARILSETDARTNYQVLRELERRAPQLAQQLEIFARRPAAGVASGLGAGVGHQRPR